MSAEEASDFLGSEPPKLGGMSAEDARAFLGPPPLEPQDDLGRSFSYNDPDQDEYLRNSPVGRVLHAFGQGAASGWGTDDIGLSPETEEGLRKVGILPDVRRGQFEPLRAFNEAIIRPAAAVLDVALRAGTAVVGGITAGGAQAATEIGGEQFGRGVGGMLEATLADLGSRIEPHVAPVSLQEAQEAHAIGQPEAVYFGTKEPAPEVPSKRYENPMDYGESALGKGQDAQSIQPYAAPIDLSALPKDQPAAGPAAPAANVHSLARQIAPDTFREYDTLQAHQANLRYQIAEQTAALQRQAEAQAPHAAEIADLRARTEDTTPRLAKKYQARLDALVPEHDAFLDDAFTMGALTRETPEIGSLRQQLLETDYRMRDLAPSVTEAMRQAAEQMPAVEEPAPAGAAPMQPAAESLGAGPTVGAEAAEPAAPPIAPETTTPRPVQPELVPAANPAEPARTVVEPAVASVAADVADKLRAAGRPADEADAAGQVTEALWRTRAEAFGGAKGTAEEMYAREAPDIRLAKETARVRQPEMAQKGAQGKIRLTESGAGVISLMRTANASTYLHEMGHDWLERMMRDGADPAASQQMQKDASAVRNYLGVNDGDVIPTKAHEKFARSFERYFMEGRAPTQGLADVFAKFKGWLTTIYQTVAKLRAPITPDIRDVFDRLLTRNPDARAAIVSEQPELFAPSAPAAKPQVLLPRLPKEPVGLMGFLRKEGGVRDEGGELANIIGSTKNRPGLISTTGMSLDAATIRAHEAGYFPENGEELPTHNQLLEALAEEMRGNRRYSVVDSEAADAYHAALAHNREIDDMAHRHDIDTRGMTREQFFDALADRVSREKFDEEIQSMDEAHEAEFGEFASEAREWAERHAERWNSDEFYGLDGPRTEPELEDAYGSENAARSAGQGVSSGEEPGPSAGSTPNGEVGGGQGGRSAGDAGRASETGSEGSGPHDPIGATDGRVVDKAGNIRMDNLNRPEDVKTALRDLAEQHDGFMDARGGVISDAQRSAMADATGIRLDNFEPRKPDGISTSVWADVVQKLTVQASDELAEASKTFGESGSEADLAAYVQAKQRLLMVADHFASVTAEAGRTLRVFNKGDMAFADNARAALEAESNGRTLFQMQKEARAVAMLDTPAKVAKFMRDSKKPSFGDMLLEYWVNGLISGPATHVTYVIGNALMMGSKAVLETSTAAALGSVREALGRTEPRVYWGEVGAQLHGILRGQRDGISAAYKAGKLGVTTELPGETPAAAQGSLLAMQAPRAAIPGMVGEVLRLPSRGVAVLHSYSRAIGYSQEISTLAYRQAASEGLTGVAFASRVADLTMNPTDAMMARAREAATTQTLMGRGGAITQAVADLTSVRVNVPVLGSTQVLKFIDPFVKIGANVMNQALLERSPLGIIDPGIRANLMGVNGAVARDAQISRIAVGSAIGAAVIGLAAEGLITGGGPSDPQEAAAWRMTGKQPYSLRIGDTWYGFHRLGPLAMVMGVAADLHEFGAAAETHDIAHVGQMLVGSFAKNLLDESFMRGPSDLMRALDEPDRFGARYVEDQLGTFLPFSTGMAQMARATDPFAREARTVTDSLKARIPWLSQTLLPRRDIFGQLIPNKDALGAAGLTAIMESRVNADPVALAMTRLGNFPGMPRRAINGVQLTDQQYDNYSATSGQLMHATLSALVNTAGFSSAPDGLQDKAMRQIIEKSRRTSEERMKILYPDIWQQATVNKRIIQNEGRHAAAEEIKNR